MLLTKGLHAPCASSGSVCLWMVNCSTIKSLTTGVLLQGFMHILPLLLVFAFDFMVNCSTIKSFFYMFMCIDI